MMTAGMLLSCVLLVNQVKDSPSARESKFKSMGEGELEEVVGGGAAGEDDGDLEMTKRGPE